jgi:hypothetical protein
MQTNYAEIMEKDTIFLSFDCMVRLVFVEIRDRNTIAKDYTIQCTCETAQQAVRQIVARQMFNCCCNYVLYRSVRWKQF